MLNTKHFKLIPATLADYPIIQNMARFYTYDLSEYMGFEEGWEMPENGLYECFDFKKYWQDETALPFLIRYQNELAGFVIIDKKGSDLEVDFNMAQFFILRKFQHKGVGKYIATECFKKFRGTWEVMVMPVNDGAYQFWKSVIGDYTNNTFTEYSRANLHLGHDEVRNMFRFSSR